tara:strand:+ start:1612 stop:1794 length:183 start_codon:yes stop_codon:yes gene_type:complete
LHLLTVYPPYDYLAASPGYVKDDIARVGGLVFEFYVAPLLGVSYGVVGTLPLLRRVQADK